MKNILEETDLYGNLSEYEKLANKIRELLFDDIKLNLYIKYFKKYIYPHNISNFHIEKKSIEDEIQKYLTYFEYSPLKVKFLIGKLDSYLERFKASQWFNYDANTQTYHNAIKSNQDNKDKLKGDCCHILFNDLSAEIEAYFDTNKNKRIKKYQEIRKKLEKLAKIDKLRTLSSNENKNTDLKRLHRNIKQYLSPKSDSLVNFINCFSEKEAGEFTPLELKFTIPRLIYFLSELKKEGFIKGYNNRQIFFVFRDGAGNKLNEEYFKSEKSKLLKSNFSKFSQEDQRCIDKLFD